MPGLRETLEAATPEEDELDELLGLWLSRLMFGWMVGMPEHRSFEEWMEARARLDQLGKEQT